MKIRDIEFRKIWKNLKLSFHLTLSAVVIVLSLLLFIYPAGVICYLMFDSRLSESGESRLVPYWFEAAAPRFLSWAETYLETNYAETLYHDDIPATEWPMFGAVFFLVTAEDLGRRGEIDASEGAVREAVEKAAEIVASPATATWVKTKWGDGYLQRENVFYRMLLIMGLASYEKITGDSRYHATMAEQRQSLAVELAAAKLHLRNDYPNECYPADMLWAVAAIQRAARLDNANHDELIAALIADFDGPLSAPRGLPAFQADARSGAIVQEARGCGNSGILLFAAELDPVVASRWYDAYEKHFWKDTGLLAGFTEMPRGSGDFADVDSGPALCEIGSVATAFGIGAAKAVGRCDRAAPLTIETVACSWPTPFGFLLPGLMGRLAADSWSLGEVALLFSMTRPTMAEKTVPFTGHAPAIAWIMAIVYLAIGAFLIWFEIRSCRRMTANYRADSSCVSSRRSDNSTASFNCAKAWAKCL